MNQVRFITNCKYAVYLTFYNLFLYSFEIPIFTFIIILH